MFMPACSRRLVGIDWLLVGAEWWWQQLRPCIDQASTIEKVLLLVWGCPAAFLPEFTPFVCNTGKLPLDMASVFALAVFVVGSGAQKLVAFDDATASSTYSSKSFAADLAAAESSGCFF